MQYAILLYVDAALEAGPEAAEWRDSMPHHNAFTEALAATGATVTGGGALPRRAERHVGARPRRRGADHRRAVRRDQGAALELLPGRGGGPRHGARSLPHAVGGRPRHGRDPPADPDARRRASPDAPEALGLAALLLAHDARREARIGADGRSVPLDRQDRSRYDAARIEEAAGLLDRALALRRSGPYQLQAAIAVLHARAPTAADTDWPQIAALYGALARAAPSPVVALNRAGASRPRRPARGARRPPMTS